MSEWNNFEYDFMDVMLGISTVFMLIMCTVLALSVLIQPDNACVFVNNEYRYVEDLTVYTAEISFTTEIGKTVYAKNASYVYVDEKPENCEALFK